MTRQGFVWHRIYSSASRGRGLLPLYNLKCKCSNKVCSEKNPVAVVSSAGGSGVLQVEPKPGTSIKASGRDPCGSGRIQNSDARSGGAGEFSVSITSDVLSGGVNPLWEPLSFEVWSSWCLSAALFPSCHRTGQGCICWDRQ